MLNTVIIPVLSVSMAWSELRSCLNTMFPNRSTAETTLWIPFTSSTETIIKIKYTHLYIHLHKCKIILSALNWNTHCTCFFFFSHSHDVHSLLHGKLEQSNNVARNVKYKQRISRLAQYYLQFCKVWTLIHFPQNCKLLCSTGRTLRKGCFTKNCTF